MRTPAVAGQFYSDNRQDLVQEIEGCYASPLGPGRLPKPQGGPRSVRILVVPHAGYIYSGPVAAHAFLELANDGLPDVYVVIGPNHTGMGAPVALALEDFQTPLGVAKVDRDLARKVQAGLVEADMEAHRYEHSIEVEIPFLQHLNPEVKILPICMGMQDYETAKGIGDILREGLKRRNAVVIASTDFSHYVPREVAARKDALALGEIKRLDSQGLYRTVVGHNISMCGYGPVMAALNAVEGREAQILKYATSGDVQPMKDVVGYAAAVVRG